MIHKALPSDHAVQLGNGQVLQTWDSLVQDVAQEAGCNLPVIVLTGSQASSLNHCLSNLRQMHRIMEEAFEGLDELCRDKD